jgi:hypothetical protein
MAWRCEYTDTFGGEANYSWVRRTIIPHVEGEKQSRTMRRAKASLGITGLRGVTTDYGDGFEFRPWGYCTVAFVQWDD